MSKYTENNAVRMNFIHEDVAREFGQRVTADMVQWAKERYGFTPLFENEFKVVLRHPKRGQRRFTSYGGLSPQLRPYISICLTGKIMSIRDGNMPEYKHIEEDPDIGAMENGTWRERFASLLAHEIAHAVDHCMEMLPFLLEKNMCKPVCITKNYEDTSSGGHGAIWQSIYHEIRSAFVNPAYLNSLVLKSERKRVSGQRQEAKGRVKILEGKYRNNPVRGEFDLIQSFQAHADGHMNRWGNGYVKVRTRDGRVMKVNTYYDLVRYIT